MTRQKTLDFFLGGGTARQQLTSWQGQVNIWRLYVNSPTLTLPQWRMQTMTAKYNIFPGDKAYLEKPSLSNQSMKCRIEKGSFLLL